MDMCGTALCASEPLRNRRGNAAIASFVHGAAFDHQIRLPSFCVLYWSMTVSGRVAVSCEIEAVIFSEWMP
jgi:hypothetical protein